MNGPFGARKFDEGDGVVRLAVHGEIDEDVGAALAMIIRNAAEQGGLSVLVVDLERCSFLAAAGVRSLVEGRRAAWEQSCAYRIVNANGIVAQVLEAAGVPGLTPVTDDQPVRRGQGRVMTLDTSSWLHGGL